MDSTCNRLLTQSQASSHSYPPPIPPKRGLVAEAKAAIDAADTQRLGEALSAMHRIDRRNWSPLLPNVSTRLLGHACAVKSFPLGNPLRLATLNCFIHDLSQPELLQHEMRHSCPSLWVCLRAWSLTHSLMRSFGLPVCLSTKSQSTSDRTYARADDRTKREGHRKKPNRTIGRTGPLSGPPCWLA